MAFVTSLLFFNWDSLHEQSLQGMVLQEKEPQKD